MTYIRRYRSPQRALSGELRARLEEALTGLPERQRIVITLRDVAGYPADEVCSILDISPANQRVLLHRARAQVRARLEGCAPPREPSARCRPTDCPRTPGRRCWPRSGNLGTSA